MTKDPAFLFYSSDFLTGIADLTMEERGQYISLLCLQHQKGHLTDKMIRLCVGNAAADVLHKFGKDAADLWFNKRLDIEIEKRKEYSDKQRQRALDGWEKRKENKNEKNKAAANATALPIEDEDDNVNRNKNSNAIKAEKIEIVFPFDSEKFISIWGHWKAYKATEFKFRYKSPQSEQAALKELAGLSGGNENTAIDIITYSMAQGWKGLFLKDNNQNKIQNGKRDRDELKRKGFADMEDSLRRKSAGNI